MKIIFSVLFFIFSNNLIAQQFELFAGINNTVFHDYKNENDKYSASYKTGYGFSSGIGLDSIKIDWLTLRITLQFDQYNGELNANYNGLGGAKVAEISVRKSILSFGFFPINIRFIKNFVLNTGIIVSKLTNESFNGTISGWQMNQQNWSYNIQDKFTRYSTTALFGFQGRISYEYKLSKSICITPQYLYYFGLSNEFIEFPEYTKSMRHYFCLGIKRN